MTTESQKPPARVAAATPPKQAGEAPDLWWWVKRQVWTQRMLTRLDQSEPTTKWFSLWDKLCAQSNLLQGYYAVWRNDGAPGVDGQTVEQFETQYVQEVQRLRMRGSGGPVEELLSAGHVWCVDADLKSYFDTIPHERLMKLVQQRVEDGNILRLLRQYLKAGVMAECKGWQRRREHRKER